MSDTQGELRQSVEEVIKDRSQINASLDQLCIFYDQAADAQALEAAGADELKPYLKAIADTIRPTTQNCFYDPTSNSINIFSGFVTSAVYKYGAMQEELLGGMGFIMGHEISHAFDYSWSQFDAYGRPDPVFTEDDVSDFVTLRNKLADYYSKIEIAPGKNINGITVSAEAVADRSGMQAIVER